MTAARTTITPIRTLFVPLPLVKILLPLVVLVVNFEHIYAGVMWILRKIPVLGIE